MLQVIGSTDTRIASAARVFIFQKGLNTALPTLAQTFIIIPRTFQYLWF